jgi:hypothetical protein
VNVGRKRGDCREWHRGMGGKGTREACPSLVATASGVSADQSGTGTRACLLKAVIMIFPVPQRLRVGRLSVPDVILPSPHARRQYSLPISSSQSFVLSSSLTRSLARSLALALALPPSPSSPYARMQSTPPPLSRSGPRRPPRALEISYYRPAAPGRLLT